MTSKKLAASVVGTLVCLVAIGAVCVVGCTGCSSNKEFEETKARLKTFEDNETEAKKAEEAKTQKAVIEKAAADAVNAKAASLVPPAPSPEDKEWKGFGIVAEKAKDGASVNFKKIGVDLKLGPAATEYEKGEADVKRAGAQIGLEDAKAKNKKELIELGYSHDEAKKAVEAKAAELQKQLNEAKVAVQKATEAAKKAAETAKAKAKAKPAPAPAPAVDHSADIIRAINGVGVEVHGMNTNLGQVATGVQGVSDNVQKLMAVGATVVNPASVQVQTYGDAAVVGPGCANGTCTSPRKGVLRWKN